MTTLSAATMPFNFRDSIQDWVLQDERPHMISPCEHNPIKEKANDFCFKYQQATNYYGIYGGIKPKEVHGWALTAYIWINPDVSYQDAIKNATSLNAEQCLEFIIAEHVGWLEFVAESAGEVFINFDTQSLDIWASKTPEAHCFAQVSSKDSIATIADKLRSYSPKDTIRYLVGDRRAALPRTKETLSQAKIETFTAGVIDKKSHKRPRVKTDRSIDACIARTLRGCFE